MRGWQWGKTAFARKKLTFSAYRGLQGPTGELVSCTCMHLLCVSMCFDPVSSFCEKCDGRGRLQHGDHPAKCGELFANLIHVWPRALELKFNFQRFQGQHTINIRAQRMQAETWKGTNSHDKKREKRRSLTDSWHVSHHFTSFHIISHL